jgi:membrane-anchored protein YejM (alkaline phosphatase superfamily)
MFKTKKILASIIIFLLNFLLLCSIACKKENSRPHIIFYLLDAGRADYFGCYGQKDNLTPHMDQMAKNGILFARYYANSFYTRGSLSNLFTGRYDVFDILHQFDDKSHKPLTPKTRKDELTSDCILLTDLLRESGYRTIALAANPFLTPQCILGSSFDQCIQFDPPKKRSAERVEVIFKEALKIIETQQKENKQRPIFLYIHLMDTHAPHLPPPLFNKYRENPPPFIHDPQYLKLAGRAKGSMAYVDHCLGQFHQELKKALKGNTIEIITADHGDSYGEAGCLYHHVPSFCREEVHRIPLIISGIQMSGKKNKIEDWTSTVDIFPTILEMIGFKSNNNFLVDGSSLTMLMQSPKGDKRSNGVFFVLEKQCGFRKEGKTYKIQNDELQILNEGQELFEPPTKLNDMISSLPKEFLDLRIKYLERLVLRNKMKRTGYQERVDETAKSRKEQLKSLGYVK